MSTFLKLLPLELDGIAENDIIEPARELEKGDREVGIMSDTVKRLFTLGRLLERDSIQSILDGKYCADKAKKLELEAKASELEAKSHAINELMWISIRDEFSLWSEGTGVRQGFKVVVIEEEENDLPPFLKRFLIGGQ